MVATSNEINELAFELALLVWERWHGPLASIPGTHEATVSSLREMLLTIIKTKGE